MPVGVFMVEDHPIMREMLREYVGMKPDLALSGEAATAAEALEAVGTASPDLVLVDVSLPDRSGIELVRELRARHPGLVVLMLSGHAEKRYVDQALEAGARGYMLKGHAGELDAAIEQVMRGARFVSEGIEGYSEELG